MRPPRLSETAGLLLTLSVAGSAEAKSNGTDEVGVSRARYAMVANGSPDDAHNERALSLPERNDRVDHGVLVPGWDKPGSSDYDVWLRVGDAAGGKSIFVEAPHTGRRVEEAGSDQARVSLNCAVAKPTGQHLSGEPCTPLGERDAVCTYTVIPPIGKGSERAECPATALGTYNDFADLMAGRTNETPHGVEVPPAGTQKLEVPQGSAEQAPKVPAHPLPMEARFVEAVSVGAGQESMGEYNLGFSGAGTFGPRVVVGAEALWTPAGSEEGLRLGASTDFAFTGEGSGWERSGATLGWQLKPVSLDARFGVSGEPADGGETALDGVPYAALAVAHQRRVPHLPGQVFVGAEVGVDFIRGMGTLPDPSDLYATIRLGWSFAETLDLTHLKQSAPTPSPAPVDPVEAPVEAVPVSHLERSFAPAPVFDLTVPVKPYGDKETPEIRAGTVVQWREELVKTMQRPAFAAAVTAYNNMLALGLPLTTDDHFKGFEANRGAQNILEAYKALLRGQAVDASDARIAQALSELQSTFGYVHIEAARTSKAEGFVGVAPFGPAEKAVYWPVETALTKGRREYEGLYPVVCSFSLGGEQNIQVKPLSEEPRVQVFTVTR